MTTRFYHRCALIIMALFAVTLVATDQQTSRFGFNDQPEQLPTSPLALRSFTDRQDKFNGGSSYEPLVYDTASAMGSVNSKHNSNRASSAASVSSNDPFYSQQHQSSGSSNSYRYRQPQQSSFNSRFSHYDDSNSDLMSRFGDVSSSYEPSNTGYASSYPANRKTFAAKSNNLAMVVSPLAGIAFIAAAAAVSISPAYLKISSSLLTGRKKRDLLAMLDPALAEKVSPEMKQKIHELQTLEKFLASVPREADYQQQIMSMYLSCSGYTGDKNVCLERVFCEYGNAQSSITEEERDVLSIVLYNIMANTFVPEDYKQRLRSAARFGRDYEMCARFDCPTLNRPGNRILS